MNDKNIYKATRRVEVSFFLQVSSIHVFNRVNISVNGCNGRQCKVMAYPVNTSDLFIY